MRSGARMMIRVPGMIFANSRPRSLSAFSETLFSAIFISAEGRRTLVRLMNGLQGDLDHMTRVTRAFSFAHFRQLIFGASNVMLLI